MKTVEDLIHCDTLKKYSFAKSPIILRDFNSILIIAYSYIMQFSIFKTDLNIINILNVQH